MVDSAHKNISSEHHTDATPATLEQPVALDEEMRRITLGAVGNYEHTDENRFLLTPESCNILCEQGYEVLIESGAGVDIEFTDEQYQANGAVIVSRAAALKADIVLSFHVVTPEDIKKMKRGATLLCLMNYDLFSKPVIEAAMAQGISLGCLDNMYDHNDEYVFQTVLDEIDGRAAVMYAEHALTYSEGGKGVLLGGIAGLLPCEVLVIGQGTRAWAAAKASLALGAIVTLMDNHVSALQQAQQYCGDGLHTSVLHPRVLERRLKTADVVILDTCTRAFELSLKQLELIKPTAYRLDLQESSPSMAVPRTVAMALSNVLMNFFEEVQLKNNFEDMMASTQGVQSGMVTYRGKLVNKLIGISLQMPVVDINIMLAGTN